MHDQLEMASRFFEGQSLSKMPATRGGGSPDQKVPARMPKPEIGSIAFAFGETDVTEEAKAELTSQRQYLIDMAGICTSYMQKQVEEKNDPELFFDSKLWYKALTALPMLSMPILEHQKDTKVVVGVEIATKFVAQLTGMMVTGGATLASFAAFLAQLKENIQVSGSYATTNYDFTSIGGTLVAQKVAGKSFIDGYLVGTFITFFKREQLYKSNCVSVQTFEFEMDIKQVRMLFNYGALRPGGTVKSEFDGFISGTQSADIERSKGFFNFKEAKTVSTNPKSPWGD